MPSNDNHFQFSLNWNFLSHVWFFVTPRTVAHKVPLSTGFSRQESWSRLPCPPSEDLPNSGINNSGNFKCSLTPSFPVSVIILTIGSLESCLLRFFKALTCFDFINTLKLCHNMQLKENSVGSGVECTFQRIAKIFRYH